MILNVAFLCALSCCPSNARTFPQNYIILGGFTVTEGVLVGVFCPLYTLSSILFAVLATAAIVGGLSCYAMITKRDFTGMGPYLFAACIVLIIFGIFAAFFPCPFMEKVYNCLGILLFSFYLIYDTQMIMGKGSLALSIDDYCMGALQLYIDIINIFLHILSLLGSRN